MQVCGTFHICDVNPLSWHRCRLPKIRVSANENIMHMHGLSERAKERKRAWASVVRQLATVGSVHVSSRRRYWRGWMRNEILRRIVRDRNDAMNEAWMGFVGCCHGTTSNRIGLATRSDICIFRFSTLRVKGPTRDNNKFNAKKKKIHITMTILANGPRHISHHTAERTAKVKWNEMRGRNCDAKTLSPSRFNWITRIVIKYKQLQMSTSCCSRITYARLSTCTSSFHVHIESVLAFKRRWSNGYTIESHRPMWAELTRGPVALLLARCLFLSILLPLSINETNNSAPFENVRIDVKWSMSTVERVDKRLSLRCMRWMYNTWFERHLTFESNAKMP